MTPGVFGSGQELPRFSLTWVKRRGFEEALINMTKSCEVHIFDYSLSPEKAEMVQSVSGATLHEYGIGAEDSFVTAIQVMTAGS